MPLPNIVNLVFQKVAPKYQLMNDLMSLGIHRLWKRKMIRMMGDVSNKKLIDVAGGTGDVAKRFIDIGGESVLLVDISEDMLKHGIMDSLDKEKIEYISKIDWKIKNASDLGRDISNFDFYTNAFGLRNSGEFTDVISEAFRVVKYGGKIFFMEFLNPRYEISSHKFYERYLRYVIPQMGKIILNDKNSYQYFSDSILSFPPKEDILEIIRECGGHDAKATVLSHICCIYTATNKSH